MAATRMENFKSELRRIRGNASGTSQKQGGDESGAGSHVVPAGLTILDVMEGDLETVLPESPMRPAISIMIESRISSVPFVDAEGRIVGALNEGGDHASDVMSMSCQRFWTHSNGTQSLEHGIPRSTSTSEQAHGNSRRPAVACNRVIACARASD